MINFLLNNESVTTELSPGLTVLDFVRYRKSLKGTKIGCREGDCGACTVLVGELQDEEVVYRSMTSCLMPLANAIGKHIVTVEGINQDGNDLTPVQNALVQSGGTQCGFCTVGFVMSMTGFCIDASDKTAEQAVSAVDGNICRCTGYKSIEKACIEVSNQQTSGSSVENIKNSIVQGIVPGYFSDVKGRLEALASSTESLRSGAQDTVFLAGGTDLYVQRHDDMVAADPAYLFDDPELRYIRESEENVEIGASTVVTDLLESELMHDIFPDLYNQLKLVSSTPIRNMATLAGNFVNASPIGDMTVWFLALSASITFNTGREILLRELFIDYKKLSKTDEESIVSIKFRRPEGDFRFGFEKVCKRKYLDIATVNTAMSIFTDGDTIQNAHVAAGGVAPVPLYLLKTSAYLEGKRINRDTIHSAIDLIQDEISPISDVRGSEEYKRLLLSQLFKAHFVDLFGWEER